MLRITNSSGWECFSVNNSPEDSGGYSSAAFGSLCTAIFPRRAARFDRHFVLSCGRNRKFKLPRIHIIAEINRFIALRSDDNIDPSLFNFKLNRNHITRFGSDNMCIGFAHPREPQEEIILIFYAVPVKTSALQPFRFPPSPVNRVRMWASPSSKATAPFAWREL